MNNSDHDDCCHKLQEKVIKITLYDKMNYKPILIGSHLRRHHYQHSPLLSYKTNQFHVAVNLIDHRIGQNVVGTSVTHSAAPRMPLFCSTHILTSSAIYY